MKILFFSCWYPTKYNSAAGVFVKEHATAVSTSGHSVAVLALNVMPDKKLYSVEKESYLDENKIPTHVIHIKSKFYKWIYINPFFMYGVVQKYFAGNIYHAFKPDILHSNIVSPTAIIGHWLSQKYKLPHVIGEHWTELDKFMKKNLLAFLGMRAYRNASAVVAVSGFLKRKIAGYLGSDKTIHVIPNVVDRSVFSYKAKTKSNNLVFSAAAGWSYPKAPLFFVNALSQIAKESPYPIILNIIGDGPLLAEVKQKAGASGYKINFQGYLSKERIASLFHESDFFVHASYDETFSVIIAEALLTGTPVVASNVGAVPELVNPSNGVLTNNTHADWVSSIRQVMTMQFDHFKIQQEFQDKFSYLNIGRMFNKLYRDIAQPNS